MGTPVHIPPHLIEDNPYQPRRSYDDQQTRELADSFITNGLLQRPTARLIDSEGRGQNVVELGRIAHELDPVRFEPLSAFAYTGADIASRFEVLARTQGWRMQLAYGHRRLRAWRLAKKDDPDTFGAIPLDLAYRTNEQMAEVAFAENDPRLRKDVSAVDEAHFIERLMADFAWTQKQVADHLGLNRSTVTNKLAILKLPEEVQSQVADGTLSERQAMALKPLFDLPEKTRNEAEESYWYKPSKVIAGAKNKTSKEIRSEVSACIQSACTSLTEANFELETDFSADGLDGQYVAPTCKACPIRLASRGKRGYCPDTACFEAKQSAYTEQLERLASADSGIPVAPAECSWQNSDGFHNDRDAEKQIIRQGCEKLHLEFYAHGSQAIADHPQVKLLCFHQGQGCSCLKAIEEARQHSAENVAKQRLKEHIRTTLIAPAQAQVKAALIDGQPLAWTEALNARSMYGYSSAKVSGKTYEGVCGSVAASAVKKWLPYNHESDAGSVKIRMEAVLQEAGLDCPWADDAPLEPPPEEVCAQTSPKGSILDHRLDTDAPVATTNSEASAGETTHAPTELRKRLAQATDWMGMVRPKAAARDHLASTLRDLKAITKDVHRRQNSHPQDNADLATLLAEITGMQAQLTDALDFDHAAALA